jgi:hypothetical protein
MNALVGIAVVRFVIAAVARNGRASRGRRIGASLLGLVAALGTLAGVASLAVAALGDAGDMGLFGAVLLGLVYLAVGAGAGLAAWRLARPSATPTP